MVEARRTKKVVKDAATRVDNAAEVAKGKVKAKAGKAVGDRSLEARGKVETAKGRAKQVGRNAKKAVEG